MEDVDKVVRGVFKEGMPYEPKSGYHNMVSE